MQTTAAAVKANEPGTLRYQIHRETKGDAPTILMMETYAKRHSYFQEVHTYSFCRCRYKDQESLKVHGGSKDFKELGRAFKKEGLLEGPMKVLFTKEAGGFASKL